MTSSSHFIVPTRISSLKLTIPMNIALLAFYTTGVRVLNESSPIRFYLKSIRPLLKSYQISSQGSVVTKRNSLLWKSKSIFPSI